MSISISSLSKWTHKTREHYKKKVKIKSPGKNTPQICKKAWLKAKKTEEERACEAKKRENGRIR